MRLIVYLLFLLFPLVSFSQSTTEALAMGQDVNVLFRNEATGSIFMHSRGFGANFRRLYHVTGKRKRLFEIEMANMRHPKEEKKKNDGQRSYFYGKLNNLLMVRFGYGYQQTLYRRAERKGLEVRMVYAGGPSLCFSKPVFLVVSYQDTLFGGGVLTKTVAYNPAQDNIVNILGRAPMFYGLQDTKIIPGLYAKLGFSIEYGELRNSIKAVEVGVIVDYFPQSAPLMAYVTPEKFFVTLYLGFHFGKRWY